MATTFFESCQDCWFSRDGRKHSSKSVSWDQRPKINLNDEIAKTACSRENDAFLTNVNGRNGWRYLFVIHHYFSSNSASLSIPFSTWEISFSICNALVAASTEACDDMCQKKVQTFFECYSYIGAFSCNEIYNVFFNYRSWRQNKEIFHRWSYAHSNNCQSTSNRLEWEIRKQKGTYHALLNPVVWISYAQLPMLGWPLAHLVYVELLWIIEWFYQS